MELAISDREDTPAASSGGRACSRPIDLVYLARFTLGNRALECEVLQLFSDQAPIYLDNMRQAADDKAWHVATHTLKGASRAVGAWKVGAAAETAEALKDPARASERPASIRQLESLIAETRAYIATLMVP